MRQDWLMQRKNVPRVVASSSDDRSRVGSTPAQRQNRTPFSMPPRSMLLCTAAYTALYVCSWVRGVSL